MHTMYCCALKMVKENQLLRVEEEALGLALPITSIISSLRMK